MEQYHSLLSRILRTGKKQFNKRTGAECRVLTGEQLKFSLVDGFPALTTRKLPVKSAIAELLGFFRGYTSAKDFRELGCKFWNCVPTNTEILTKRGYLSYEDVQIGDETIGYNPETGKSEWTKITAINVHESAEVYRYFNSRYGVECTENHKWLVERRFRYKGGNLTTHELLETNKLGLGSFSYIVLAKEADTGSGLDISISEASLLGWVAGDGWVEKYVDKPRARKKPSIGICQIKTNLIPILDKLLTNFKHARYEYKNRNRNSKHEKEVSFRLCPDYAADLISRVGHPKLDALSIVIKMSSEQRKAWLEGIRYSEGSDELIYQTEGVIMEAIKLAIYLEGFRPSQSFLRGKDKWKACYALKACFPIFSRHGRERVRLENQPVWCPTTELGTWTARQRHLVFLTGNSNANETKAWLENPIRLGTDDVGEIYGAIWNNWETFKFIKDDKKNDAKITHLLEKDWAYISDNWIDHPDVGEAGIYTILAKKINQLEEAVRKIMTDPSDRRIIVSAWNPGLTDFQSLPACFTHDALVTMKEGYRHISAINVGDYVVSGSGNLKKVTETFKTPYKGQMVSIRPKYVPEDIRCTPNHPFLVKDRGWVEAKDLKVGDYLAIKKVSTGEYHTYEYKKSNTGKKFVYLNKELTNDDYFTLGYFLGNGWLNRNRHTIYFSIPKTKEDKIVELLRKSLSIYKSRVFDGCVNYEIRTQELSGLFSQFGYTAKYKYIPEWVFNSPKEAIEKFIEGYFEADGYEDKYGTKTGTTVSVMLAMGIQRLATYIDKVATLVKQCRPKTTYIEGRLVNQSDTYSIYLTDVRNNYTKIDDEHVYVPIRQITTYEDELFVYNLSVEDDHTYNVNNIVTHNCHMDYRFTPFEEDKTMDVTMTMRSADSFLGVPSNIVTTAVFLHVVCVLTGYTPGTVTIQMANAHLYENSFEAVETLLKREHRELPALEISENIQPLKSLEEISGCFARIKPEDFILHEYNPHDPIAVKMMA